MTKKQLQVSYDAMIKDRMEMISYFGEIRSVINPQCKLDGVSPWAVLNAVKRLYEIGSIKPFTDEQLTQWQKDLEADNWKELTNDRR